MQTFLVNQDVVYSALILDPKRLNKQVVEASQIINTISGASSGWANHPAVLMWKGYLPALQYYYNIHYLVAERSGIRYKSLVWQIISENVIFPKWWNDERVYRSHRSNLLRKDYNYYKNYGWEEDDSLPYFWPTNEGY